MQSEAGSILFFAFQPSFLGSGDKQDIPLRFFPEGGNPVQGLASRIAFEATDESGTPIDITGIVMDERKQELFRFSTLHEGRGVFTHTCFDSNRKAVAEVEYSGKKYRFDLPAGLPQGVVMEADNVSDPDSIGITLRKNGHTPAGVVGLAVLTGGNLQSYSHINLLDGKEEISFKVDKTGFPSGVSQIVLFNGKGEILCDRLVFTGEKNNDFLDIRVKPGKQSYNPHEPVEMEFSVSDRQANPVNATFSLSIRDGESEVEYNHNVLTELLLMSEIKGYVRDPSYYFETDDAMHRSALDVLLMVQGWRRYSWKQMAGLDPVEIKYPAEQGIETTGKIVSLVKQKPQPDVDVTLMLQQRGGEDEDADAFIDSFVTDGQGGFSFVSDVSGRWNMLLAATEKGRRKDHRILLDRIFSPEPKRYRYADMQVNIAGNKNANLIEVETLDSLEEDFGSFLAAYQDSLSKAGITDKIHDLPEVTVKAKKNTREQDIRRNRSTSSAYYDMASELDDIYDRGKYVGDDIHQMLINTNNEFNIRHINQYEFLFYKGRRVLFVVNYKRTEWEPMDFFKYLRINLNAIKSIYINENKSVMCQYAPPRIPCIDIDIIFGCAVFIETYPDDKVYGEDSKGVRKTWLEGYSPVREFYSPDYSALPPESDYRRTLYWNPSVTPDENGIAKIQFYNNSSCKDFSISAETVTPQGMTGVYKNQ